VKKINEALSVIGSELKKIKQQLVPAAELKKAKEYIKGKTVLALEDNHTRLDWYLEQVAFEKKILTPQEFFHKIDSVTPQQIKKLSQTLFDSKRFTLAVIGPYKNKEREFLRQIK
jgi:predicted Zn-dependent peptidase